MNITPIAPREGISTVERWVFERELRAPMTSRGIVPPWLEPGKAWPPLPGPTEDADE